MTSIREQLIVLTLLIFTSVYVSANVSLPAIFTNNMVLQQKTDVHLWGKAAPKKNVRISTSWNNKTYQTKAAANGTWDIQVSTPIASYTPYNIIISDGKAITLSNILIGDIWVCSGQSNMEMPLAGWGKVQNYQQEISTANYPNIRLFHVARATSNQPQDDLTLKSDGWQPCSPATIPEFSAVGYFFGRELQQHLSIPIGLIDAAWGGTLAEAWISGESIASMPDFAKPAADIKANTAPTVEEQKNPNRPTVLFNAMIHPYIRLAISGVIWYQGEANADCGRSHQYQDLFPLLINDWRKQWNNKDLPFYFVQLASFRDSQPDPEESAWAELREAQAKALNISHTGMAVTIDIGDAKNIHPKNKQEVGRRLSLIARADAYGEKNGFSGPLYKSYRIENNTIRLSFTYGDGLKTNDGQAVKGFAVAGVDHIFHWATATIDGNDILVSSPDVAFPIAVRYAWANNPACNLYNGAGLPCSPFRTDDWPGLTFGHH